MLASWHGFAVCVIWHLWKESIGRWWTPLKMASNAELWCFLCCYPDQAVMLPMAWDELTLMWCHSYSLLSNIPIEIVTSVNSLSWYNSHVINGSATCYGWLRNPNHRQMVCLHSNAFGISLKLEFRYLFYDNLWATVPTRHNVVVFSLKIMLSSSMSHTLYS